MSRETLKKAAEGAAVKGGCPLLCMRYEEDKISPGERTDVVEAAFVDGTMKRIEFPGDKHAVLTYDRHYAAFAEAIGRLKENFGE